MAGNVIKLCVDRMLPDELVDEASTRAVLENPANVPIVRTPTGQAPDPRAMALLTGKLWKPGRTLHARFLGGDPAVQAKVAAVAPTWSQFANIQLAFDDSADAEIRIAFEVDGSWSYIGTDALMIPADQPTMNYGWLTPDTEDQEYQRVVLHEFGHALGCIHEHQHPKAGIPWDKPAVYAYYAQPPNSWSKETVDQNIFQRYSKRETRYSKFDDKSIMLYAVPNELTIGDYEVGWNTGLSPTDKRFIKKIYPARK